MRFFALTVAGCAFLLAIDATPGLFSSGLLCPCFSLILLVHVVAGWGVAARRAVATSAPRRQKRLGYAAAAAVVVTVGLSLTNVPSRVALRAVRGEFEALLATAPQEYGGAKLDNWVGCFYVDKYAADESGGVYFRTASHADGIGPDAMSYGFAYRPHRGGNPFGMSKSRVVRLFGDWYWFSVSSD